MENNRDVPERSSIDNFAFGVAFFGLVLGAAGVLLTTPGIALTGLALVAIGLCCFGLKRLSAG